MRRIFVIFLLLPIFISSCLPIIGMDMDFTLKSEENWDAALRLKLTPSGVAMLNEQSGSYQQQLNRQFQSNGLQVEMGKPIKDKDGNTIYPITVHGKGYASLNQSFFSGNPVFTKDTAHPGRVNFHYNPGMSGLGIFNTTITLRGGRILSSNSPQSTSTTATWINPSGEMEAVREEQSGLGWVYILVALLIVGGVGLLLWVRRSKSAGLAMYSPVPTQLSQPKYCSSCGKLLPASSAFCPECGKQI